MTKLRGVVLTVNYPDDEAEAAIPSAMSIGDLANYLRALVIKEPEATSFVLVACIDRAAVKLNPTG